MGRAVSVPNVPFSEVEMSFMTRRGRPCANSARDMPAALLGWLARRMALVMELTSIYGGGGGRGVGACLPSSLLISAA